MMSLSIAITTFNRQEFVVEAVRSICCQDGVALEVLIIDDASDVVISETELANCNDCVPKVHTHEHNKGLAASRNTAIEIATGKLFSFCDDDDQWPPGLASRLVTAMESAPDDVGMAIAVSEERKASCGHLLDGYPLLSELMKAGLTPPVGSQIYRTKLLRQIGGYRSEVTSGVDHDLWISLARIDPRVAVAWGEPAIVGSCPSRDRITTVESRRRAGIEKSLAIWRDDLVNVFGDDFFHHFVFSYRQYLDCSFLIKSIQKGDYFDAITRVLSRPSIVYKLINQRINILRDRKCCFLFPEYKNK